MAAFSNQYHNHPFLLDSVFFQNPLHLPLPSTNMSSEEPHKKTTSGTSCLYQPADNHPEVSVFESSCIPKVNNESNPLTLKQTSDSLSVVLDQHVTLTPFMDKKRKYKDESSSFSSAQSKVTRDQVMKSKKPKKNKVRGDKELLDEEKKKGGEDQLAPTGYVHVRARRGQATDSHSLAERVRREKISERMKMLQALVPGCDKITGKALMLDEIINYVQSLQNQVEFLSMMLASVNPMFNDFDAFMAKPEKMSTLEEIQPNLQQCSPNQSTATINSYGYAAAAAAANNYPQGQMPNYILSQSNGQGIWEAEEQRQKNISQYSGFNNNLCSFH